MTKNSIILRGVKTKAIKIFYSRWKFICLHLNLFACILIYYNKSIHFNWIYKKNIRIIKFSLKYKLLFYKLGNKNHLKNINDQNFSNLMRGLRQRLLRYYSMLLTNWGDPTINSDKANYFQANEFSMWAKLLGQFAWYAIFLWSLIGPLVLPDRDWDI